MSAALEDDKVDRREYREIYREIMEDIESGMALLEVLRQEAEKD